MTENMLGDLILLAKGDDRSIREYARDSEVDAAIISKMINGNYIPKKPSVYLKLASDKAAPRNGITYEQLLEASNAGTIPRNTAIAAGSLGPIVKHLRTAFYISAAGTAVLLRTLFPGSIFQLFNDNQNESENTERMLADLNRYAKTAQAIITSQLAIKGIPFKIDNNNEHRLYENIYDTYLQLNHDTVTDYLLRYAYIPEDMKEVQFIIEETPKRLAEELFFTEPVIGRKISIAINNEDSYNFLLQFKDRTSYKGDLSIILLDMQIPAIIKETYLAHYESCDTPPDLLLV